MWPFKKREKALNSVDASGGWYPVWPFVREPFSGAWQQNKEYSAETVLAFYAVYSCITLIASDIAKLRTTLVRKTENGIWSEYESAAFSPVLKKPNRYQTSIQFKEYWMISKLSRGNTYALKQRDERGVVTALYILDPCSVTPLVADDGSVYYQLRKDNLAGQLTGQEEHSVTVPASEIIHDRMNCLFHPLVGISPLYACGLSANQGLAIQRSSEAFFENGAIPSGILTAPGTIKQETAERLKTDWQSKFSGDNAGNTAILGDGLKYEPLIMNAVDSQLIDQLKMSAEVVCSTFHVPRYMVGVGSDPTYNNIEALNLQYYSQCLQSLIESWELVMDEGLGLGSGANKNTKTQLDLDGLLRMDTAARYKAHSDAIGGGWLAPNEARKRENLAPSEGGNTPYMQQQNYSLAALNERDTGDDPMGTNPPPPASNDEEETERAIAYLQSKELFKA